MLSQTYMMSQFTSKVNTVLSHHIHRDMKNDDIIKTSEIIKILKGYPVIFIVILDADVSWVSW